MERQCCTPGQLRAYLDQELPQADQLPVAEHLTTCAHCTVQLATLQETAQANQQAFASYLPASIVDSHEPTATAALARFQAQTLPIPAQATRTVRRIDQLQEQIAMNLRQLTAPRFRPALAAAATVIILALLVAFSPLSSLANQLVRTFRVQQFAAVTVRVPGMKTMPQVSQFQQLQPGQEQQLQQMLAGLGTLTTNGTKQTAAEVTDANAAKAFLAQYGGTYQVPGKLPAAYASLPARYGTIQPTSSTYALKVAVARQYLTLANSPELNALPWPAGVDTLTFGLDTPAATITIYGDGQSNGLGILQMANLPNAGPGAGPALKLPDELDVNAFRAALLALPNLPPDTVAQLKNVQDWDRTLIIPVPEDATTKNVSIKGNAGLLILDGQGRGGLLLWQANGNLYAVGGAASEADLLLVANNLTTAR